jgi:uncharacterized Tic20 family protein
MPEKSSKTAPPETGPPETEKPTPPALVVREHHEIAARGAARRRREMDYAGLCHLCNALPLWGLICNGLVWFAFRERSRYLVGQTQQAMYFHGLLLFVIVIWMLISAFTKLVAYLVAPVGAVLYQINLAIIILVLGLHVVICAIGAWRTFNGQLFCYPFVGEWFVEREQSRRDD